VSALRSEKLLYRASSSLGLAGLAPMHVLLRRDFECERRRLVGEAFGGASRQGEREPRVAAGCALKRENEANARERKGRGVVGL
jgi:hypothetical protein